ncbi:MAG: hypothetical protein LBK61_01225 [Spirochaetaceae bacterium]|nr:hypothetical protein [Spirochaetaceae bacterium]
MAFAVLFAGCDAVKGLLGEDDGSSGSGGSGGGDSGSVPVVFQEIKVAGGGTTTLVTLVFDRDIPGLSEGDVTITDAGDTGAVAGVLSPTGVPGAYTLAVSGVRETGEITISVGKSGCRFSPASRTAVVNFDETAQTVTFASAIANGAANTQTTTALALAFSSTGATFASLQPGDITLWPGSTGAALGNLVSNGDGAYMLTVSDVAAEGEVFVTVVKDTYAVRPATVRVPVHYQTPGPATGGTVAFTPVEGDPSMVWEIHTFTANGTLDFGGAPPANLTAQVLVVAGGGGGGLTTSTHVAAGGGAGGYIYAPSYPVTDASIPVTVGAGGAKPAAVGSSGQTATFGDKGGDSVFGGITAFGGGGGASHNLSTYNNGQAGGSGGGGTYTRIGGGATPGTVPPGIAADNLGYKGGGGNGAATGDLFGYSGAGGGGSGGAGGNVPGTKQGESTQGGPGTVSDISGQAQEYARGGDASNSAGVDGGANTGNGGSGGTGADGNGGSGIVIVRFQRPK